MNRVQKETLQSDLAQIDTEIAITETKLSNARNTREQALVRAPLDGVVIQIYTRQGERVSTNGIAKIVDLSQLRVLADVDGGLEVPADDQRALGRALALRRIEDRGLLDQRGDVGGT